MTSPTRHGLHGWDSPDHRERDRGCSEHLRCGCVSTKKKESQSSSSSGKKQKASSS